MNARLASLARCGDHARFVRIATAFGALAIGALIYALVRPQAALFIPTVWHHPVLASKGLPLATALIGAAPTFLHAFAMSILIVVTTQAATLRCRGWCCAAVSTFEFAFEVAQTPVVAAALLGSATTSSGAGGITEALRSYLKHGTFDPLDLVAAVVGSLAAFSLLAPSMRRRRTSPGAHHAST